MSHNNDPEKHCYIVDTDCGSITTCAVSEAKAMRNACYRLVMADRKYKIPRPQDLAEMREIEILCCRRVEEDDI